MAHRSFVHVEGENIFDYGFAVGDYQAQQKLRQMAIDVRFIQLMGKEREAALRQFANIPYPHDDKGPLVYYGDMAKFIARHLRLIDPKRSNPTREEDYECAA